MAFGKSIELFLVDGTSDGIVTAELSNWNGKAIKIPRTEVLGCKRPDIQGVGVYFLLCQDDDGGNSVYIGEAENVLERLGRHIQDYLANKESYYWNTAVAFTGRDLNKALIRYLEHNLVEIARENPDYRVLTKTTYRNTVLKESQRASMDEFINNVKVLMGSLGYKVLSQPTQDSKEVVYQFCSGSNAEAKGYESKGGFTVLANSIISDHVTESFKTKCAGYYKLRSRLIADGIIEDRRFTKDYEFSSPSAASSVVLGRASNGKKEWGTHE